MTAHVPRPLALALILWLLLAPSCATTSVPEENGDHEWNATIYRDAFGVAHVHGTTDADAAYGLAYAQAQDNFWQVEENFVRAIGRGSELYGKELLLDDWINRSLEIPRWSREEFDGEDEALRDLLRAFAAGFNDYLRDHPDIQPRVLTRFEPWYPLALIRYLYYQRGFLGALRIPRESYARAFERLTGSKIEVASAQTFMPRDEMGSNSWAISTEKSASGNPYLFINPHLPFFGPSQVYEAHVLSDDGWNFTGYGRFGFPMPYVGFNEHLGWASTDNAADLSDAYVETFDNVEDPLAYRYDGDVRKAVEWKETLYVREGGDPSPVELTFRRTHHGPLVAEIEGRLVAAKLAKLEGSGWLAQWLAMTRSRSLDEFRQAVEPLNMLFGNYLYADREGNIFYCYNAAIPIRSEEFDFTKPVEGQDPRTEWQGYHSMDQIPQVLNPSSGYIQNCNSTPFTSTSLGNPKPEDFPKSMVIEGDTARARNARRILESKDQFTFEEWKTLSYDTTLVQGDVDIPQLQTSWESLREQDPARAETLSSAMDLLTGWDRVATLDSTATTLYVRFFEKRAALKEDQPLRDIVALEKAIAELETQWGTHLVPWKEVNRHQRVHSGGRQPASDDRASLPVVGAPSWAGPMFTFWGAEVEGQKRRYGRGGNSYVAIVEFGPVVRGYSLHPFGSSTGPEKEDSPKLFERYARGDYKPAWLSLDDVREHAMQVTKIGSR